MNHYETVFILNPVLSETQVKETVKKFEDFLLAKGAEFVSKEDWGLKNWPIQSNTRKVDSTTCSSLKWLVRLLMPSKWSSDVTSALCVI